MSQKNSGKARLLILLVAIAALSIAAVACGSDGGDGDGRFRRKLGRVQAAGRDGRGIVSPRVSDRPDIAVPAAVVERRR